MVLFFGLVFFRWSLPSIFSADALGSGSSSQRSEIFIVSFALITQF